MVYIQKKMCFILFFVIYSTFLIFTQSLFFSNTIEIDREEHPILKYLDYSASISESLLLESITVDSYLIKSDFNETFYRNSLNDTLDIEVKVDIDEYPIVESILDTPYVSTKASIFSGIAIDFMLTTEAVPYTIEAKFITEWSNSNWTPGIIVNNSVWLGSQPLDISLKISGETDGNNGELNLDCDIEWIPEWRWISIEGIIAGELSSSESSSALLYGSFYSSIFNHIPYNLEIKSEGAITNESDLWDYYRFSFITGWEDYGLKINGGFSYSDLGFYPIIELSWSTDITTLSFELNEEYIKNQMWVELSLIDDQYNFNNIRDKYRNVELFFQLIQSNFTFSFTTKYSWGNLTYNKDLSPISTLLKFNIAASFNTYELNHTLKGEIAFDESYNDPYWLLKWNMYADWNENLGSNFTVGAGYSDDFYSYFFSRSNLFIELGGSLIVKDIFLVDLKGKFYPYDQLFDIMGNITFTW